MSTLRRQSFRGDAASVASSVESKESSKGGRLNNLKHSPESGRLQEMVKLYSTLQEEGDYLSGTLGANSLLREQENELSAIRSQTASSNFRSRLKDGYGYSDLTAGQNLITRIQKAITKRLFEANYVLLAHQAVTPLIYQIIILVEFFQLIFFVFNKVVFYNEFIVDSASKDGNLNSIDQYQNGITDSNSTLVNGGLDETAPIQAGYYELDDYFAFLNFPTMILSSQSTSEFLYLFLILNSIFIAFLGMMFGFTEGLFQDTKNGRIKDTTRNIIKALSLVLSIYVNLLLLPMMITYLQMFLCNEDVNLSQTLDVSCSNTQYQVLVAISAVLLITFIIFLFAEHTLYASRSFTGEIPWATFEQHVPLLKILLKMLLGFSFIFDKQGSATGYIDVSCAMIFLYIIYKRLTTGILMNRGVYYTLVFYETLLMWLFLCIGAFIIEYGGTIVEHDSSTIHSEVGLLILIGTVISGIIVGGLVILVLTWNKNKMVSIPNINKLSGPLNIEIYFFRIYQHIERFNQSDSFFLNGVLSNHMHYCGVSENCKCFRVAEKFDDLAAGASIRALYEKRQRFLKSLKNSSNPNSLDDVNKSGPTQPKYAAGESIHADMSNIRGSTIVPENNKQNFTAEADFSLFLQGDEEETKDPDLSINHGSGDYKSPKTNRRIEKKMISEKVGGAGLQKQNRNIMASQQLVQKVQSPRYGAIRSHNNLKIDESRLSKFAQPHSNMNILQSSLQSKQNDLELEKLNLPKSQISGDENNYYDQYSVYEGDTHVVEEFDSVQNITPEMLDGMLTTLKSEEEQQIWYQFLSFLLQDCIEILDPQISINLKLANALIQSSKLKNEFQAIFDLLTTEASQLPLQTRFTIFRMKIMIEHSLIVNYSRVNSDRGNIDINVVYNYEKLFQKYSLLEYVTANSALMFWRELLSKSADQTHMQERGNQISRNYAKIHDLVENMTQIYPNELKFLFRYGLFLKQIINNKYEAMTYFKEVYCIFYAKISKQQQQQQNSSTAQNEIIMFGENSESAIVIISANAHEIGKIMHANEEVRHLLGHAPKEIIGKNVNILMPSIYAEVHSKFIEKYFETGQQKALNNILPKFGLSKEGYLKCMSILLKVYPRLNNKIMFIAMMKHTNNYTNMEPPKSNLEKFEAHYIITDYLANIIGVSEGLNNELGLNAKFFRNNSSFVHQINFGQFQPQILEPSIESSLESYGEILKFNTSELLDFVELEALSSEDVLAIRQKLGQFNAYVQLKKFEYIFNEGCLNVNVYRLILVPNDIFNSSSEQLLNELSISSKKLEMKSLSSSDQQHNVKKTPGHLYDSAEFHSSHQSHDDFDLSSVSSMSSTNSDNSFTKMIKDFKKALGVRKTPGKLMYLNRMIILINLITILFTIIEYYFKIMVTHGIAHEGKHSLGTATRNIYFILLASNIRTLINVANQLEETKYDGDLKDFSRFEYLTDLIQTQAYDLQLVQHFDTQQRMEDMGTMDDQAIFEYLPINLTALDSHNEFFNYTQPYRVAFNQYLFKVLELNHTAESNMKILGTLLQGNANLLKHLIEFSKKNSTTLFEPNELKKSISFILLNGLRSLRQRTTEANELQIEISYEETRDSIFLSIMIAGILVCIVSVCNVLYQLWVIERNKQSILSLYGQLSMDQIKRVYDKCDDYLERLYQSGCFEIQQELKLTLKLYNSNNEQSEMHVAENQLNKASQKHKGSLKEDCVNLGVAPGNRQNCQQDLSEEEKDSYGLPPLKQKNDQYELRKSRDGALLEKPQDNNLISNQKKEKRHRRKSINHNIDGHNTFAQMIVEQTMTQVREIQNSNYKQIEIINDRQEKQKSPGKEDELKKEKTKRKVNNKEKRKHKMMNIKIEKKQKEKGVAQKTKGSEKELGIYDDDNTKNQTQIADSSREAIIGEDFESKDDESSTQSSKHRHSRSQKGQNGVESELQHQKSQQIYFTTSSIKSKNWRFFAVNSFVGLIFSVYFVYSYWFHISQVQNLIILKSNAPTFFNRYNDAMLAYSFLRERIINNNSLDTFYDPESLVSPLDPDEYYRQRSLENEREIQNLKSTQPKIIQTLLDFTLKSDSSQFCKEIIGQHSLQSYEDSSLASKKSRNSRRINTYQTEIDTVIAANNAAFKGNIEALMQLKQKQNMDFSLSDYDKRTPLHLACLAGHVSIVKYLIDNGAKINALDRWGATPLNYARDSFVQSYLQERNAQLGVEQPVFTREDITLSDDQYRFYYAAYYGDLALLSAWQRFSWEINVVDQEGRTALMIAASEGRLEAVKFIINQNGDPSKEDVRGNTLLDDAKRENRTQTISYLRSVYSEALIKHYCDEFLDGLLEKGISQAFGNFHKKLSDLQIIVNSTKSYPTLLSLLGQESSQSPLITNDLEYNSSKPQTQKSNIQSKIVSSYIMTQELYFYKIIQQLINVIKETQSIFIDQYVSITQIMFITFLVFQLSILLILRTRLISLMKEDVFQSRGVLNLIPEEFFEENREAVEKIIKKLKD